MKSNKEQAIEIANEFIEGPFKQGCYLGAMKMAEYKDQQFKEYLEKTRAEYENSDMVTSSYYIGLINEIINELFKED